jgi:hypothetical protein
MSTQPNSKTVTATAGVHRLRPAGSATEAPKAKDSKMGITPAQAQAQTQAIRNKPDLNSASHYGGEI